MRLIIFFSKCVLWKSGRHERERRKRHLDDVFSIAIESVDNASALVSMCIVAFRLVDDRCVVCPEAGDLSNPPKKFRGNSQYSISANETYRDGKLSAWRLIFHDMSSVRLELQASDVEPSMMKDLGR